MKKGIIVASFGTSFPDVLSKSIGKVEDHIRNQFKDHEVRRAFTSNMIIKKLKQRDGVLIDTPSQAIDRMIEEGYKEIHVQPLHVIPGFEYDKVKRAVVLANHKPEVEVTIGQPLLAEEDHYDDMVNVFDKHMTREDKRAYVLMGHGTHHHANACYSMLQMKFNDKRDDVFIANVEGYPELDHVIEKLEAYDHVTLMPLMIVAGDHAMNDMAGDEDSFKTALEEINKEVTCILKGMGEYDEISDLFVGRIK